MQWREGLPERQRLFEEKQQLIKRNAAEKKNQKALNLKSERNKNLSAYEELRKQKLPSMHTISELLPEFNDHKISNLSSISKNFRRSLFDFKTSNGTACTLSAKSLPTIFLLFLMYSSEILTAELTNDLDPLKHRKPFCSLNKSHLPEETSIPSGKCNESPLIKDLTFSLLIFPSM